MQEYEPNPATKGPYWVSVVQTNVLPRVVLDKCLRLFGLHKLDVLRCHMDRVDDPGNGHVCQWRQEREGRMMSEREACSAFLDQSR